MRKRSAYIAAALLGAIIVAGTATMGSDRAGPQDARAACQTFVERKVPGPATFSGQTETGKHPTFTARGIVASRGIRVPYSCAATHDPAAGKWYIDQFELGRRVEQRQP